MRRAYFYAPLLLVPCLSGCSGTSTVSGVLTLDGKAVEGATVEFISEDGSSSYNGFTDASGKFTLAGGNSKGVPSGTYRVVVVKRAGVGFSGVDPSDPEAMKLMQKEAKDAAAASGAGKPPGAGMMMTKPGMMMPKKGGPAAGGGVKSDLPAIYATADTTPIRIKVPLEKDPVEIQLNSKPS